MLLTLLGIDELRAFDAAPVYAVEREPDARIIEDIHAIDADSSIPETQRAQLAKARVGQGLFRKKVILLDEACRVTGVNEPRLLIASHIKPWREATNAEGLSGHNGLLLAPHVDALFDDQWITFEDDGRMRVSASLPPGDPDPVDHRSRQARGAAPSRTSALLGQTPRTVSDAYWVKHVEAAANAITMRPLVPGTGEGNPTSG